MFDYFLIIVIILVGFTFLMMAVYGLSIFLFQNGRRLTGLKILGGSFIGVFVLFVSIPIFFPIPKSDKLNRVAEKTDRIKKAENSNATVAPVISSNNEGEKPTRSPKPSSVSNQSKNLPNDDAMQQSAQRLEVQVSKKDEKQIKLPKGYEEQNAINHYCDWEVNSWEISLKANKKFGEIPMAKNVNRKIRWENSKQTELARIIHQGA